MKVAVIQGSPVLFDKQGSTDKVVSYVHEVAERSVDLILFPEAFIPAYPRGLSFGAPVGTRHPWGRALWQRYWDNSVDVTSGDLDPICEAARNANSYIALGVIERVNGKGILYCSLVFINPSGEIIGVHRKLKPTGAERIIWGEGDGSSLKTYDTPFGKIGGLICWENYMPLARMALYQQGIHIYLAPTADHREGWTATLRHIALESRCYVLGCNQFVTKDMYPKDLPGGLDELTAWPEVMSKGGSIIVDPLGNILEGPVYDEESILYAELDMNLLTQARMDFDPAGHYSRPDIFEFGLKHKS